AGKVDRWFFVRYGEPQWHLRVRLHGQPRVLHELLPDLLAAAEGTASGSGLVWRSQVDTYEREVERFGGPLGIELAERAFHLDSEAVLHLLERLGDDPGGRWRWRAVLVGVDRTLDDFGVAGVAKTALLRERAARSVAAHGNVRRLHAR